MANRSYLYSFSEEKDGKTKVFDISEQNYEIPIIYKILVSANTKVVPSKLFDDSLALVGDAQAGRKKLNAFFKKLHKEKAFDEAELSYLEEEFQNHLDKYTLDYFLFEPVEVISMDEENTDKAVKKIAQKIKNYDQMIADYLKELDADDEYWDDLGIDCASYLYYSMGNQEEVEKIEKQFSNKKLVEVKALIAKKPTVKRYIRLIKEIRSNATEVDKTIDKILELNPNFEQLWNCAYTYNDLDKKIALYKQIAIDYPNEEKIIEVNYWISSAYEKKKDYANALKYRLQYIIDNPDEEPHLDRIIKGGKFNKQEIYDDLSKKIKNKYIEEELIKNEIKNGNYEKALKTFYELDEKMEWENGRYRIIWAFLEHNQLAYVMELIEKHKLYNYLYPHYKKTKEYDKMLYVIFKYNKTYIGELIYDFYEEKIDYIKMLEQNILPNISEFKPKKVLKIAEDLLSKEINIFLKSHIVYASIKNLPSRSRVYQTDLPKEYIAKLPNIAKQIVEAIIPYCKKEKHKAKADLLLCKIKQK